MPVTPALRKSSVLTSAVVLQRSIVLASASLHDSFSWLCMSIYRMALCRLIVHAVQCTFQVTKSVMYTVETITLAPIIFLYCYFVHLNIFQ